MELSRAIHMSNQHTLNFQRSKTEHEGNLDAKSANLQKIHTDLCGQLAGTQAAVAAFVCVYSYVFWLSEAVGFQQLPGKQAGRLVLEGVREEAPSLCLELPPC